MVDLLIDRSALTCRPIAPEDEPFLSEIYATTRDDLRQVPWENEEQKSVFLALQFRAQHKYYLQQFPKAALDLILLRAKPVGRFYLDRRADEIRILDLSILPEFRNRGIGTLFLKELLDEGGQTELPVTIYLQRDDPARRLYERLGFTKIEESGFNHLLEWRPADASS